ncbi:MAG: class I SAM-dependent methyltransferase [Planctomycetota bacterium]|nr:class I SAM-dependent methyltransferase [Planctomycetota bacterium]
MTAAPWWSEAFASGYVDLYPHRDLDSARAEARFLVSVGLRGRVLDLCCGWGRHLIALEELGLEVAGLDYSADLLARLVTHPEGTHVAGHTVRGDARRAPFRDATFDGVVSLFSSFGYFGDAGDAQLLAGIARVLAPGGAAFLDVMNPEFVRAGLVPESRREADGAVLVERRSLPGRSVRKEVELWRGAKRLRAWYEEVRLYEPAELEDRVASAGLAVEARWGDFDGSSFGPASPRQLLRLRRAPGAGPR